MIHSKYFSVSDWLKSQANSPWPSSLGQILGEVCDIWKMTLIVQHKCLKDGRQPRSPGEERALQNGVTFLTFVEDEIADLLPKNIVRTARTTRQMTCATWRTDMQNLTSLYIEILNSASRILQC